MKIKRITQEDKRADSPLKGNPESSIKNEIRSRKKNKKDSEPIKGKVVILPAQHQVVNQRYLSKYLPRYDRSISQENFKNAPIGKSGLALAYGGSPIYLDNSVLKAFFLVAGIADTVVVPGEQVGSYSYPYKLLLQWSSRHELLQIRECL